MISTYSSINIMVYVGNVRSFKPFVRGEWRQFPLFYFFRQKVMSRSVERFFVV